MGKTVHFPLLACLLVSACGTDNPEDMRTKLMQSWGQEILLSNYESFVEATATLSTGAESLCDGPTAKKLEDLQETWWKARAPWKRMDAFNFGPYTDEPLRLGPKIDFWPARISAIDALLAGNGKITEQSLAEGGAANRGMPVVEYLLYADAAKDVALWKDAPRRCDYLLASTADLHTNAERMHEAWSPLEGNYLRNLVDAGQANTAFMDPQAALGEVVNRMAFLVENIRSMKLTKPLGTEGKRSPDTVESRFSGRSVEDIRDNLSGIATLYWGAKEPDSIGLTDYLHSRGHDFDADVDAGLNNARRSLDQLGQPLSEAIFDQPETIESIVGALQTLQRTIQVDIMGALGLAVTFNDNDGD